MSRSLGRLQGTRADGSGDKRPVYSLDSPASGTVAISANSKLLCRAVGMVTRSGDTRPLYVPKECHR